MDDGIPDKVGVQVMLQIEAGGLLAAPLLRAYPVKNLQNGAAVALFPVVPRDQVARSFRDLTADLHPH